MDCTIPRQVKNGILTLPANATYYGAPALYSCLPNFELVGVSRRLCLENGTWSGDEPTCNGKYEYRYTEWVCLNGLLQLFKFFEMVSKRSWIEYKIDSFEARIRIFFTCIH